MSFHEKRCVLLTCLNDNAEANSTKCLDPFTGSYASDSTFGVMHSYLCQTETPAFDLPHHGIFHMMSHSVSCGAFVRDFHSGSSETLLRDLFLLLLMIAIAVGWWFLVRRVQEKGDTIVAGWFVKIPRPGAQPRLKQQDVNAVPIQCKWLACVIVGAMFEMLAGVFNPHRFHFTEVMGLSLQQWDHDVFKAFLQLFVWYGLVHGSLLHWRTHDLFSFKSRHTPCFFIGGFLGCLREMPAVACESVALDAHSVFFSGPSYEFGFQVMPLATVFACLGLWTVYMLFANYLAILFLLLFRTLYKKYEAVMVLTAWLKHNCNWWGRTRNQFVTLAIVVIIFFFEGMQNKQEARQEARQINLHRLCSRYAMTLFYFGLPESVHVLLIAPLLMLFPDPQVKGSSERMQGQLFGVSTIQDLLGWMWMSLLMVIGVRFLAFRYKAIPNFAPGTVFGKIALLLNHLEVAVFFTIGIGMIWHLFTIGVYSVHFVPQEKCNVDEAGLFWMYQFLFAKIIFENVQLVFMILKSGSASFLPSMTQRPPKFWLWFLIVYHSPKGSLFLPMILDCLAVVLTRLPEWLPSWVPQWLLNDPKVKLCLAEIAGFFWLQLSGPAYCQKYPRLLGIRLLDQVVFVFDWLADNRKELKGWLLFYLYRTTNTQKENDVWCYACCPPGTPGGITLVCRENQNDSNKYCVEPKPMEMADTDLSVLPGKWIVSKAKMHMDDKPMTVKTEGAMRVPFLSSLRTIPFGKLYKTLIEARSQKCVAKVYREGFQGSATGGPRAFFLDAYLQTIVCADHFEKKYNAEPAVKSKKLKFVEFIPVCVVCGTDIARSVSSLNEIPKVFEESDHMSIDGEITKDQDLEEQIFDDYKHTSFSFQCFAAVEQLLPGLYKKHNYNFFMPLLTLGSDDDTSSVFSQYTYEVSGRSCIICDLQGVETADRFIFTDPAILTLRNDSVNVIGRGRKLLRQYNEQGAVLETPELKASEMSPPPSLRAMHELMTNVGDGSSVNQYLKNFKDSEATRKLGLKQDGFTLSKHVDAHDYVLEIRANKDGNLVNLDGCDYQVTWLNADGSEPKNATERNKVMAKPAASAVVLDVSINATGVSIVSLQSDGASAKFLNPKVFKETPVPQFMDGAAAFEQETATFNQIRDQCCLLIDSPVRRAEQELALVEHLRCPFMVFSTAK